MRQSYEDFMTHVKSEHIQNQLTHWKVQLVQFQEKLSHSIQLHDLDLYDRANELYEQLQSHMVGDKESIEDHQRLEENTRIVPIGGHRLPPLPYAYDALEPYIDEETMRLHHDIHHKSYVDGLNKAEKEMQKKRSSDSFDLIKHWEREAAFNGAGHYLHTIFWEIMNPHGGGEPTGELMNAIEKSFGSFNQFKAQFTEAANAVEGSGWAILVWSPRARRLEILQAEKHQNLSQWDVLPLLVLDVWEHAYYLKYQNKRKDYIENWWHIVNWPEVEKRFNKASTVKWKPY